MAEKNYYVDMASFGEAEAPLVQVIHGEVILEQFGVPHFRNITEIFKIKSYSDQNTTEYSVERFAYDDQGHLLEVPYFKMLEPTSEVVVLFESKLPEWIQKIEEYATEYDRVFAQAMKRAGKTEDDFPNYEGSMSEEQIDELGRREGALLSEIASFMGEVPQFPLVVIDNLNHVFEDWEE